MLSATKFGRGKCLKKLKNNRWQERLKIVVTASLDIRENVLRKMFLSSLNAFHEFNLYRLTSLQVGLTVQR
jgi:hypothetical protein